MCDSIFITCATLKSSFPLVSNVSLGGTQPCLNRFEKSTGKLEYCVSETLDNKTTLGNMLACVLLVVMVTRYIYDSTNRFND